MSKRLSYQYVKGFIEQEGYKLLSNEYINAHIKLELQCSENHIFEIKFNDFQQGHKCPECYNNKRGETQKHSYSYIKKYIEQKNYKLLSIKYIDAHSKLELQCPKKHKFEMKYNDFQQGMRCPICFGTHKHTYQYVKNYIESFEYKLLSKKYKNNKAKLKLQCPKGHIFEVRFCDFKTNNSRCPQCSYIDGRSKPEKEISNIVKSIISKKIIENDRTQIINPKTKYNLELDLWIPSLNKAIEFNGIYWHSDNYSKYKEQIKLDQCLNKGIDLLIIQEQDWIINKDQCINNIKNFIRGI